MIRLPPLLGLIVAALAACGRRDVSESPPPPPAAADAAPRRAPPGKVHAYPPHAIRSDGVGPYLLGEQMRQVLRDLPEGPHLELVQVGGYANWRVARAEGGAIVIGAGASNEVTFVSVLRPDVARTSDGFAVGAAVTGLRRAGGAVLRDRTILEHPALAGVTFLTEAPEGTPLEELRIAGVVVAAAAARRAEGDAGTACAGLASPDAEVIAAARLRSPPAAPLVRRGCVTGPTGEAFVVGDGELVLVGGEPGKLRRLGAIAVGRVELAGALELDGDRRDEIVLAAQLRSAREHAVEVRVVRWETGKLVEVLNERPFSIGEAAAAAAGVTPEQIDLTVEVRPAGGGALQVGGFYSARRDGVLRELAPLEPVVLRVETRRPPVAPAAGPDGGGDAHGALDGPQAPDDAGVN